MYTNAVSHTEKYQTLQLFRMEDIIMSLDDRVTSATDAILQLLEEGRSVVIATSFGKDSATFTSSVMNAARDFAAAGGKPLVVATSSNTLVKNPEVHAMAKEEMGKLHAYARAHGIRFFGKFVTPQLLSTFQVKILSGRGIPSWASGGNDCTVDLKISGQKSYRKKLFRTISQKGMPEPVTCLGMRIQESEVRAARMKQSGARAETPVRNKDGELVLCPVSYWSEDEIFEYLGECSSGLREGLFGLQGNAAYLCALGGNVVCSSGAEYLRRQAEEGRLRCQAWLFYVFKGRRQVAGSHDRIGTQVPVHAWPQSIEQLSPGNRKGLEQAALGWKDDRGRLHHHSARHAAST